MSDNTVKRIAIFRALQLGDLLCAMPAVRAIREFYPKAEVIFIGLPHTKSIIERFKECIDRFVAFPGYPGLPEQEFDEDSFRTFVNDMRDLEIDLLFQLQGNGSIVYDFLNILGAKRVVGFCELSEQQNANLMWYPEGLHEVDRHLALLNYLHIACDNEDMFFPVSERDKLEFDALGVPLKPKAYICIHPGSRSRWRQWPTAYFAPIGDFCRDKGLDVVITGSESELDLADELADRMKNKPVVLAGKTSLGAVGYIIENAFGLVANCTGVSHIAAALKTPSVIVSMDGEPHRWGPKNKSLHSTIDWTVNPNYKVVLGLVKEMIEVNSQAFKMSS